jgi:DeoR/GlpR family transcriptional regulator of sugar metabolism
VLARQRQAHILDRIREDGAVKVADLVRELGVSDMTVRRDLEVLHILGLLEKVHGGATTASEGSLFEPGFAAKSALQEREKSAIASAAARLIEPGSAIALSAGRTPSPAALRRYPV